MAMMQWGDKKVVKGKKAQETVASHPTLHARIAELEQQIKDVPHKIVEVIKEVPTIVEREVIVPVERIVERVVEVQVIKEFPVMKEKIVTEFVDRPITVVKEVEKEVIRQIKFVPLWAYGALLVQSLIIVVLLFK